MTNDNKYLEKLHNEILSIMDFVNDICKKNEIKYYLVGGSLLGAIRHKGFIPWDDDLDIAMSRVDLERFINLFGESCSIGNYYIKSKYNDITYKFGFAKVFKKDTIFKEYEDYEWPIFLDIFVLDETDGYSKKLNSTYKYYERLENMRIRKNEHNDKSLKTFFSKLMASRDYNQVLKKSIAKNNGEKEAYYTNFFSQYGVKRQTMPKNWYGKGVEREFEGRKYMVPIEYEKFLTQLYGANYMEVPPVEKRRTHYPLYVKFSDGEEMYFEKTDKKVTIEDTLR